MQFAVIGNVFGFISIAVCRDILPQLLLFSVFHHKPIIPYLVARQCISAAIHGVGHDELHAQLHGLRISVTRNGEATHHVSFSIRDARLLGYGLKKRTIGGTDVYGRTPVVIRSLQLRFQFLLRSHTFTQLWPTERDVIFLPINGNGYREVIHYDIVEVVYLVIFIYRIIYSLWFIGKRTEYTAASPVLTGGIVLPYLVGHSIGNAFCGRAVGLA